MATILRMVLIIIIFTFYCKSLTGGHTKLPGAILDVAPATARRVGAMDGGHKELPEAILNVAPATARRVAARDGGHKKAPPKGGAEV